MKLSRLALAIALVPGLSLAQDTSNDDGAIVDCFVDLELDCLEP